MEKINFKDLPDETTPINAENLNKFQENIENSVNEETERMQGELDGKLTDFDTKANQKITDVQQQVDTAIEEMKGLVDVDKVEELQQKIETLENNVVYIGTCTEEELQAAIDASD